MTESWSKQGVSHILEFGERKQEDKNFEKTMLPEAQESGQERILQENTYSLSDNIQAVGVKKQEDENKTLLEMIKN